MADFNKHSHLWNDLPADERKRLMPHVIESQKLHILQCQNKAIRAHKTHMKELNDWIKSLDDELARINKPHNQEVDKK